MSSISKAPKASTLSNATDRAMPTDLWGVDEVTEVTQEDQGLGLDLDLDLDLDFIRFDINPALSAIDAIREIQAFNAAGNELNAAELEVYKGYIEEHKESQALKKKELDAARAKRLANQYASSSEASTEFLAEALESGNKATANLMREQALQVQTSLGRQQMIAASKSIELRDIGSDVISGLEDQRDRLINGAIDDVLGSIEATGTVLDEEAQARKKLREFHTDKAVKQIRGAMAAIVGDGETQATTQVDGNTVTVEATTI